jgi:hypothetical protein
VRQDVATSVLRPDDAKEPKTAFSPPYGYRGEEKDDGAVADADVSSLAPFNARVRCRVGGEEGMEDEHASKGGSSVVKRFPHAQLAGVDGGRQGGQGVGVGAHSGWQVGKQVIL